MSFYSQYIFVLYEFSLNTCDCVLINVLVNLPSCRLLGHEMNFTCLLLINWNMFGSLFQFSYVKEKNTFFLKFRCLVKRKE